jgi:hypothetical protein
MVSIRGSVVRSPWRARSLSKGYTKVPSPEIEPAPPCPESYALTKYRAEKSVPDGNIYTTVLPEQRAPAIHPLLAR